MPKDRARVLRIGFRAGKALPVETVWEGEEEFIGRRDIRAEPQLVSDRLLVTNAGGVIELRENKVLSSERDGETVRVDETKVVYQIESSTRVKGLFTFEYATGAVTRIGKVPAPKWHDKLLRYTHSHSPDHKHALQWENGNELILFRKNQKPKSLGKDFKMGDDRGFRSWNEVSFPFPVLWLDNGRFLTQRDNGKLVTVDTDGKVTDVATIKDVPAGSLANLYRDRSGAIIYSMVGVNYKIDIAKKAAEKSEWYLLGNGFEVSYEPHKQLGYTLRHSGKSIGQFRCMPFDAKTVPGYLALPMGKASNFYFPHAVSVWSVATGNWTTLDFEGLQPNSIVGWIK